MSSDPLVKNASEHHDTCNLDEISISDGKNSIECLFCLESAFEPHDLENQHVTETGKQTVHVNNFATIFPCACTIVHAHGPCLQQWLRHEQACPLCKQSFSRNQQSSRQPTIVTEFVNISDDDTNSDSTCNVKYCSYCMMGIMIMYLIWGSNLHIS